VREGDRVREFIIVRVYIGLRARGYRSVIATTDGRPANYACSCSCLTEHDRVRAIDLVLEDEFDVCSNCRNRKDVAK
jgi:predicted SprT family Zn-dependent metalloprotease